MTPHDVMIKYFKEWAFTAYADAVQVHSRCNVQRAKDRLKEHGMKDVRVTYVSDGRKGQDKENV